MALSMLASSLLQAGAKKALKSLGPYGKRGSTAYAMQEPSFRLAPVYRSMAKYSRRKTYRGYGTGKTKRRGMTMTDWQQQAAIRSLNRRVGGFQGLELKFFDTSVQAAALTSSAALTGAEVDPTTLDCLNSMTQGPGEQQRLGRNISMKSITVKCHFHVPIEEAAAAPESDIECLIALVLDKQTNLAQMDSEDVFTNKMASAKGNNLLFRNVEHTDRFQVLASRKITLRPRLGMTQAAGDNNYSWGGPSKEVTLFKRWKGKKVLFKQGATGTIADIEDNSLHIVCYCNLIGATLSYNARLRFTTS